jgi:acyl carrier protein
VHNADDINAVVKQFILEQFLASEEADELTDQLELFTNGILDSIAMLKLVVFLEERFAVQILPHETGLEYMNTLADISRLVASKQAV